MKNLKTLWKLLPLALPFLVLVAVLSSCGKKSGITGQMFNNPKNPSITNSAQLATGAGAHDLQSLTTFCQSSEIKGYDGATSTVHQLKNRARTIQCVRLMGDAVVDANTISKNPPANSVTVYPPVSTSTSTSVSTDSVLPNAAPGWLITSSADADDSSALAVYVGATPLMHVGDTKVVSQGQSGAVTVQVQGIPKGKAIVFVYQCYGLDMNPSICDPDILKN